MKVTPEVFSVYDEVDRTTNYIESDNRTSNLSPRSKPSCHNFVRKYFYFPYATLTNSNAYFSNSNRCSFRQKVRNTTKNLFELSRNFPCIFEEE